MNAPQFFTWRFPEFTEEIYKEEVNMVFPDYENYMKICCTKGNGLKIQVRSK